jgi:hypothetical protein
MEAARDRFFSRVEKLCPIEEQLLAAENEYERLRFSCWLWKGCCHKTGHGQFRFEKKTLVSHRFSYCLHNHKLFADIDGLVIRHRCDIPNCVNPEHLIEGTQADNVYDMKERGRTAKGESHGCSKLTAAQVESIRADTRLQREIASDYSISQQQVGNIKRGVRWSLQ